MVAVSIGAAGPAFSPMAVADRSEDVGEDQSQLMMRKLVLMVDTEDLYPVADGFEDAVEDRSQLMKRKPVLMVDTEDL